MDEPHIAVLMFTAHRSAERRVFDAVRNAGFAGITLAQARIAARIGPDGTRLSELAEQAWCRSRLQRTSSTSWKGRGMSNVSSTLATLAPASSACRRVARR